MPVSCILNIPAILQEVIRCNPEGIYDIGIGCGKFGVLCREVLEGVHGRVQNKDWKVVIAGLEGFPQYENSAWGCYTEVHIGDLRDWYTGIVGWPLVLAIDVIEHHEQTEALVILQYLVKHNKRVIVSVPVGVCPQEGVFGNDLETHRSTWHSPADFRPYDFKVLKFDGASLVVSIKGEG